MTLLPFLKLFSLADPPRRTRGAAMSLVGSHHSISQMAYHIHAPVHRLMNVTSRNVALFAMEGTAVEQLDEESAAVWRQCLINATSPASGSTQLTRMDTSVSTFLEVIESLIVEASLTDRSASAIRQHCHAMMEEMMLPSFRAVRFLEKAVEFSGAVRGADRGWFGVIVSRSSLPGVVDLCVGVGPHSNVVKERRCSRGFFGSGRPSSALGVSASIHNHQRTSQQCIEHRAVTDSRTRLQSTNSDGTEPYAKRRREKFNLTTGAFAECGGPSSNTEARAMRSDHAPFVQQGRSPSDTKGRAPGPCYHMSASLSLRFVFRFRAHLCLFR
jgi:hypothetical protein